MASTSVQLESTTRSAVGHTTTDPIPTPPLTCDQNNTSRCRQSNPVENEGNTVQNGAEVEQQNCVRQQHDRRQIPTQLGHVPFQIKMVDQMKISYQECVQLADLWLEHCVDDRSFWHIIGPDYEPEASELLHDPRFTSKHILFGHTKPVVHRSKPVASEAPGDGDSAPAEKLVKCYQYLLHALARRLYADILSKRSISFVGGSKGDESNYPLSFQLYKCPEGLVNPYYPRGFKSLWLRLFTFYWVYIYCVIADLFVFGLRHKKSPMKNANYRSAEQKTLKAVDQWKACRTDGEYFDGKYYFYCKTCYENRADLASERLFAWTKLPSSYSPSKRQFVALSVSDREYQAGLKESHRHILSVDLNMDPELIITKHIWLVDLAQQRRYINEGYARLSLPSSATEVETYDGTFNCCNGKQQFSKSAANGNVLPGKKRADGKACPCSSGHDKNTTHNCQCENCICSYDCNCAEIPKEDESGHDSSSDVTVANTVSTFDLRDAIPSLQRLSRLNKRWPPTLDVANPVDTKSTQWLETVRAQSKAVVAAREAAAAAAPQQKSTGTVTSNFSTPYESPSRIGSTKKQPPYQAGPSSFQIQVVPTTATTVFDILHAGQPNEANNGNEANTQSNPDNKEPNTSKEPNQSGNKGSMFLELDDNDSSEDVIKYPGILNNKSNKSKASVNSSKMENSLD